MFRRNVPAPGGRADAGGDPGGDALRHLALRRGPFEIVRAAHEPPGGAPTPMAGLPALLFAMVPVMLLSPSPTAIAVAIGVVSWPLTARLTRVAFLKIRGLEHVTPARAIGARNRRIIWKAILFEAELSLLGLGDPDAMSWGPMIGANREYILDAWWPVIFPGLAIFFTVFAVSLIDCIRVPGRAAPLPTLARGASRFAGSRRRCR